jgi:hypothetical protein
LRRPPEALPSRLQSGSLARRPRRSPRPGTEIPPFSFPSIRGGTFSQQDLLKGHTLVALVPAAATRDKPAFVDFESLKSKNAMFRFAVVYDRGVQPRDTLI